MKYLIFCTLLLLFSCNKEKTSGEVIDTHVDIFVEDANGSNLLVQGTPNAINFDAINLMYLVNGDVVSVYDPKLDCPKSICLITDTGSERLGIFPNQTEAEEYPITYIDWGNGDIDTLKCHFVRKESSISCDKVWFNGTPMFPDNAMTEFGRAFKIVK